ncbi:MAG: sulfurtransferase complex subunit TusB [Marinobacter sp.]|nr:sulfurtransferase complex subunit TusB [Marinobacter sp.]
MNSIKTLHILNKSPEHPRAMQCLAALSEADTLFLIENGTLLLATASLPATGRVVALSPDVAARGLQDAAGPATIVGFDDMVSLSLQAQRVISW